MNIIDQCASNTHKNRKDRLNAVSKEISIISDLLFVACVRGLVKAGITTESACVEVTAKEIKQSKESVRRVLRRNRK